jgi:hypothetical protein
VKAAFTVAAGLLLVVVYPTAASAADSTRYPGKPGRGKGVAIPFEGYTAPGGGPLQTAGAVGVDLVLGSSTRPYLPCQNPADSFIDACEEQGSYTTYTRFAAGAGLLFPHGYFMGNVHRNVARGGNLRTGWGAHAAGLSVEFYPETRRDKEFVHPRFYVDRFDHRANGWSYSANIGRIAVRTLADPGTTRVGGSFTDAGAPVAPNRVRILVFGGHATSSTGFPISSFAVWDSTGKSSWTSGPMYAGPQRITVTDRATGRECTVVFRNMTGPDNSLDFDVSRPGFGRRGRSCNF